MLIHNRRSVLTCIVAEHSDYNSTHKEHKETVMPDRNVENSGKGYRRDFSYRINKY